MAENTDKRLDALKTLLWRYPGPVGKGEGLHKGTLGALEKEGLVKLDAYYEQHWPPRPAKSSHFTWAAELTEEGIQEALRAGFTTHSAERCFMGNACSLHTSFEENRIPMPVLKEVPQDSATPQKPLGTPVYHTRTGKLVGYLAKGKFIPAGG